MTCGEFIIPTTHGFATRGRNYTIPTPPPEGIEAIPQIEPINYWILSSDIQFKININSKVFFIGALIRFTPKLGELLD